jgi:3,4-dihydroxy 2-butanone 4-phosphate synthase/GTP cyclohydrolase II
MADRNTDPQGTAFTIAVDAHERFGVTTGISAHDRAKTIEVLMDPETVPGDLRRPGHMFPLRAKAGGVLRRVGQTEASVDLARLAGLPPVGVICEILNEDGTMARRPELERFAQEHRLKFITVADLVAYRLRRTRIVERVAEAALPTRFGDFRVFAYESILDKREHLALVKGDITGKGNVLVRMHSECMTGDVFGSERCDCGEQLAAAMRQIEEEGQGAIIYLRQEGRGIGLERIVMGFRPFPLHGRRPGHFELMGRAEMGARCQGLLDTALDLGITVAQHQGPMAAEIIHVFVAVRIPFAGTKGAFHVDAVGRGVP